jgi:hypothetical protein
MQFTEYTHNMQPNMKLNVYNNQLDAMFILTLLN